MLKRHLKDGQNSMLWNILKTADLDFSYTVRSTADRRKPQHHHILGT
jgi:hypothetical protein